MSSRLLLALPYFTVVVLIVLGLAVMLSKRNVVKILMGVSLMESAVNLFLVATGYRHGGVAPIFTNVPDGPMVLPTVQALTLTSIVIGVATSAMLGLLSALCRRERLRVVQLLDVKIATDLRVH